MPSDRLHLATASVVIPTCNRRALLQRCLEALTVQTIRPHEVFVVNDCSTDNTEAFLQSFAQDRPNFPLQIMHNDAPRGANASRNSAIARATGDIIALLDNDAIAEPQWLEELLARFTDDDIAAVVGRVNDERPENLFDLTLFGTHLVHGPGPARRILAGNIAIRRNVAARFMLDEDRAPPTRDTAGNPDTTVSARGDEEGLHILMTAAGLRAVVAPKAAVLHVHHHTGRSMFRQAWRGGRSAARLVYKYRLSPRIDMLPFLLAYISLPLALLNIWLLTIPALFMLLAIAAITYNDLFLKRKTIVQTIITFPLLLAYYHVRLVGYVLETLRLRLRKHNIARVDLASLRSEGSC